MGTATGSSGEASVVLVSRDSAYAVRTSVTVVEVSTAVRGIATEMLLGKKDGLPKRCGANADSLVTIPKTWLERRVASLQDAKADALDEALRFALALT